MNQRYRSAAVVSDGTPAPSFDRDPELYYQPTTWPGARVPHVWLQKDGRPISTLDVAGKGRFVVFTGIGGERWVEAARKGAAVYGISIEGFVIGPGQDLTDLYGEWADAREIGEAGLPAGKAGCPCGLASVQGGNEEKRLASAVVRILGV